MPRPALNFMRATWALALGLIALVVTPAILQAQTANGIAVGDAVEVLTGFGWTPAKVVAVNGNAYRVVVNGIQVTKDYPAEVRRIGGATAHDHASGQYRLGDRVQVKVDGRWLDAKVVTEMGSDYQVALADGRTAWASGPDLRAATSPPPTEAAPRAGVPPKPGMASCAGKIEGRYASAPGVVPLQLTFRGGKATMTDMGGNADEFECWTGDGKIILRTPGKPELDMPIDINDDGTLQTPVGEVRKKGK